jgi:hypothetical protein
MRRWGVVLILASLPAWTLIVRYDWAAYRTGFGYELGSPAWPIPHYLLFAGRFGLLSDLAGFALLTVAMVRSFKKKRTA